MSAVPEPQEPRGRPYADAVQVYLDLGWSSPIPLGPRAGMRACKAPIPKGYGGRDALVPGKTEIENWTATHAVNNIGLHLVDGQLGIDVDDYDDKHGGDTLAELEARLGPLPPCHRSTSRGADNPSGIRVFRVPAGLEFITKIKDGGIEFIQPKHRHVTAWPSMHELQARYEWYDLDKSLMPRPPRADELAELPAAWVEFLRADAVRDNAARYENAPSLERDEAVAWLTAHGGGEPCRATKGVLRKELAELAEAVEFGASRYDAAVPGVWALVSLAVEGHTGVRASLKVLRDAYHEAVAGEKRRDPTEWSRQVQGAIEKAAVLTPPDWAAHAEDSCPAPDGEVPRGWLTHNWTDVGNAAFMVEHLGSEFRYCYEKRCWFIWNGRIWERDFGPLITRMAKATVLQMQRVALDIPDDETRTKALNYARRCEAKVKLDAMIALAQSEPAVTIRARDLNPDPWLFCCENGTLELLTGELREHRREDLITVMAPVTWRGVDFRGDGAWSKFMAMVTGGSREMNEFLQRAAFESASGSTQSKCFLNLYDHGIGDAQGDTGKTALTSVLRSVWGEYAAIVDADVFLTSAHGLSLSQETEIAACDGKRLVVSDEVPPGRKLSTAMMKKLAKGTGSMTFRAKHEKGWEGKITFTIWLDGNNTAKADSEDHPLWTRWRLVPFTHKIPPERIVRDWAEKMCASSEFKSAVLAWVLRGRLGWLCESIGTCPEVAESVAEVRESMDELAEFWARCEFGEGLFTSNDEMKDAQAAFYNEFEPEWKRAPNWSVSLRNKGCVNTTRNAGRKEGKKMSVRGWLGISVQSWTER